MSWDKKFFQDFLRRLFHHRRKLMRRVLVGMYSKQLSKTDVDTLMEELGHDAETRAETLDVPTFVKLGNKFCEAVRAADAKQDS